MDCVWRYTEVPPFCRQCFTMQLLMFENNLSWLNIISYITILTSSLTNISQAS